ncbi:MAG: DEAD/DEAH box helicase [Saprospiraceae bacterium]|nr:DEAD/DEAH box helicase [Saprospiraceae bacterium]
MLFNDLSLIEPLLRALEAEGYERPTPIQQQAIPPVLAKRDLLGCAQTGTGKTAAFALPMLQLLHADKTPKQDGRRPIRALILTPTRELALQISESFTAYGRNLHLRNTVIFGGVGQTPQTDALRRGTDILVATPGRLLDLMNQGFVNLRDLSIFVLDEADRMLDMGFIHDVRKVIAKLPTQRQTLFFSATMPPEIAHLADSILNNPVKVEVAPPATTAELVAQKVFFVDKKDKKNLLIHLMKDPAIKSALIFTRTKHGANRVAGDLTKAGIRAEAIHGNKSQSARVSALNNFKNGSNRALVATDIAARGIDIDDLSHVINFELPNVPETYVHRIGRTGRAGASGIALSFCEAEELPYLKDIQKLIGQVVPVESDHPFVADLSAPVLAPSRQQRAPQQTRHTEPQRREERRNEQKSEGGRNNRRRNRPNSNKPQHARQEEGHMKKSAGNPLAGAERGPGQPERREQTPRPFEPRPRREDNRQQVQRTQAPAEKNSKQDIANEMRRRFSSILDVASIEKQDFKRKPKPRFDERTSERKNENRSGNSSQNKSRGRGR